jgi:colanic acid biosynthesis glycosyl transferase WcaI
MTRILVVSQHFWPEQFRVNDIVDFALEHGFQIDVLCGRPNYPSGKLAEGYTFWNRSRETYGDATLFRSLEIPRGNNSSMRIFFNYVTFPLSSLFWVPWLLTKKYDAVFVYQLSPVYMGLAGLLIGKLKRIPITTYVLDLWPENLYSVLRIKNVLARRILRTTSIWFYKSSEKLIALSDQMRSHLMEVTMKSESQVIVIPQVAEQMYETRVSDQQLRRRFEDTFNLVYQGNISPAQSLETIVDAADLLRSRGHSNLRWVIVGDGMSRQEIERLVKKRGLGKIFSFEGHHPIEDMPKYADIADVLIGGLVTSEMLEATIPAKVFSYLASGKPIVLAMDGEVATLINDEIQCGFVGPSEDVFTFAENIEKIYYLAPGERNSLGRRAENFHRKHFKRDFIMNRLFAFVQAEAPR